MAMTLFRRSLLATLVVAWAPSPAVAEPELIDSDALADELAADSECLNDKGIEAGMTGACAFNALQRRGSRSVRGTPAGDVIIEAPADVPVDAAVRQQAVESLLQASANSSSGFGCGAMYCASGSTCCQSRNNHIDALCCDPTTICYFSYYNDELGLSVLNQLGVGTSRCFACDKKQKACTNPRGGSKYYGNLPSDTDPVEGVPYTIAHINQGAFAKKDDVDGA